MSGQVKIEDYVIFMCTVTGAFTKIQPFCIDFIFERTKKRSYSDFNFDKWKHVLSVIMCL